MKMTNGKLTAAKLKDMLDEKGCEIGRFNRDKIINNTNDINKIGNKMDKVLNRLYWTIILNLLTIISGLVIFILTRQIGG